MVLMLKINLLLEIIRKTKTIGKAIPELAWLNGYGEIAHDG